MQTIGKSFVSIEPDTGCMSMTPDQLIVPPDELLVVIRHSEGSKYFIKVTHILQHYWNIMLGLGPNAICRSERSTEHWTKRTVKHSHAESVKI